MDESIPNTTVVIKQHTILQSLALHLLPGILGGILYFSLATPIKNLGYPSIAALMIALVLVLTPFQIGFLVYQRNKSGRDSFDQIILYRERLPVWQYLIWVPFIFITSGLIVTFMKPITEFLASLFDWLPGAMVLDMGLTEEYSLSTLIPTYILLFIFGAIIGPTVEELYFRGYLLPRMPSHLKRWNPLLHSLLMALYHTWTPWMFVARTVGLLPLVYIVQRKKNIYLGIISHCLLNTIDVIIGVAFILNIQ